MRFLATSVGTNGNFAPLIRVCRTLMDQGHEVIILTQEPTRAFFQNMGFVFEMVITSEELSEVTQRMPNMTSSREKLQMAWDCLLAPVTRRLYEKIKELYIPGETMLLASAFLPGARLANEKLGIPLVSMFVTPWENFIDGSLEETDEVLRAPLDALRAEYGLAPMTEPVLKWSYSRDCAFAFFPEWFCTRRDHWPHHCLQLPFMVTETPPGATLEAELERFLNGGDPPLVFVYGSYNLQGEDFIQTVIQICSNMNRRGIILGWSKQMPADLPDHIMIRHMVNLELLLPRTAVFIHHSGIGTIAEGIHAAVPQIGLPNSDQQQVLAGRIAHLGIGLALDLSRFHAETMIPHIDTVLNSEKIKTNCQQLAARIDDLEPRKICAKKILEYAKKPSNSTD